MAAAVLATSKAHHGSHHRRRPRRWRQPSTLTATACVFELIETTTPALVVKKKPVVNVGAARHREALRRAKVLTAIDPTTLEIRSGDFYKDYAGESRHACLESKQEIRLFEERRIREGDRQIVSERQRREPVRDAWSPDAARLAEAAAAAAVQPGGLGVGPRVPLTDAYGIFQVLNLTERNITTVDPAFAYFTNLAELDLGRNRLQLLGNLPEGLVTLSCAANELSGRALDGVSALPLLSSLDLSYNKLGVDSLLTTTKGKCVPGQLLAGTNLDQGNGGRALGATPPAGGLHFHEKFPVLEHLDLSWNSLSDLGQLVRVLSPLGEGLRHLFLAGNPVVLLPAYRERILSGSCGSGLLVLDDLPVSADERGVAAAAMAAVENGAVGRGQEPSCDRTMTPKGGQGRRSVDPLDVVHFGVKLLGLSRIPDLGTTTNSEESPSVIAATAPVATTTAPAIVPSGGQGDEEQGEAELSPPNRWGEIEFHIRSDAGNGGSITTGPGAFPWASEVTPPNKDGEETHPRQTQLSEENSAAQQPGASTELYYADRPADAERGRGDGKPWKTTISVPPSKPVRDGVCFRGLCVLLFAVEETEEQQPPVDMATEADEGGGDMVGEGASTRGGEATPDGRPPDNDGVFATGPPGGGGDGNGGNGEAPAGRTAKARIIRQRRLVGRGYLPLSKFLDAAWMNREQQRLRQQQTSRSKDGAAATAADGHPADQHAEAGAEGDAEGGAAGVTISGTCDLMLEPWVVENLRQGVATRNKERQERKAAARAEAEANAASDPKGKNAKAAAAAPAAKGQQEAEDEEEEDIGPSPSAAAQMEVTLNSGASLRAFASSARSAAATATAAAALADAW